MTKLKFRKPDASKPARLKPKHGKRRETGSRKAASHNEMRRRRAAVSASVTVKRKSQPYTKQAQVIEMLRAPSGTTIDAMMRMTGWQQHSVRGFLTAVIRKKLSLDLRSEITDGGRVYRILDRVASPAVDIRAETVA
jgi:hypothetical protein